MIKHSNKKNIWNQSFLFHLDNLKVTVKYNLIVTYSYIFLPWPFGLAVWHSCQWQIRGRKAPQLPLGHLRVGELQPLSPMYSSRPCCLVQSYTPAYVPGSKFGFVKLLASLEPHCTWWVDEQYRPAGFESQLVPDLPPFIPTLIGLRAFDLVSSPVWWEAGTNIIVIYSYYFWASRIFRSIFYTLYDTVSIISNYPSPDNHLGF